MHSLNEIQADLDGPQQAFPVAAGGVVCSNLHSAAGSHNHSVYKEPGTLPVAGCKAHFAESVAKHPEWECAILTRRIVRLNETKLSRGGTFLPRRGVTMFSFSKHSHPGARCLGSVT